MRPKIECRTSSKDSYKEFCEKYPSIDISCEDFRKVIYTHNEIMGTYALDTGEEIKMMHGLGPIIIHKYKPKKTRRNKNNEEVPNYSLNWPETLKQGKYIYHFNYHTEGYKFYWMWNHWKTKIKFSYIWKVEMTRHFKRTLAAYLKKPNSPYKDIYKPELTKRR